MTEPCCPNHCAGFEPDPERPRLCRLCGWSERAMQHRPCNQEEIR